ncbi:hypothetical protein PYW08_013155 [Mythimna loreyi]|uniref:Uncharacterized protein n=1 Tax=Mythimna loreyi TaxID=667449 RepID=A0ACC2QHC3_9NEOP|nr:hypothetical protein PYW08_013155 [Mythimna loreyi]
MATYNQPTAKRQKVREPRADNVDYFQGIDKIEYNNMASPSESASYRYYNSSERVHSRPMEDWLKYSVALDFRSNGSDSHGRPTHCRSWDDNTDSLDNHKRHIKALFDLCSKLGVKYWTAFDSDLVPHTDSWEENKANWEDVTEYIQELMQRYHVKLLWLAPDLHSHPRYVSGAFTSNDAATFIQAATQIKRCLEVSQRLNAECFLIWPYREGYHTPFQTDVAREIKLFAKLLKLTAEYKDRINYRCQLLIMPYNNNYYQNRNFFEGWQHHARRERDLVHTYMWDITSCLYLLKNYNLDRYYKVSVTPGHHMYMANVYNMLGGVTMTNDWDHYDSRTLTLMMKCIVDQGTTPPGGINLALSPRRDSEPRDVITAHVKYVDACARALRVACSLSAEQILSKHLQQRYSSYYSGLGSRIISSDISMEECEEYYKKNQPHGEIPSSKFEHLDVVFQRHLDACDHI